MSKLKKGRREVGAYEAKTYLPQLLGEVSAGYSITITKHGVPIATLQPVETRTPKAVAQTIEALKSFRRGKTLGGLSLKKLIEQGRR